MLGKIKALQLLPLLLFMALAALAVAVVLQFGLLPAIDPHVATALLGLTGVLIIVILVIHFNTAELWKQADKQRAQHERNQEAILRLLDEISNLADGDLTVHATVTEDFTGAIADSFNT